MTFTLRRRRTTSDRGLTWQSIDQAATGTVTIARDAHALLIEHDDACKTYASERNRALVELRDVYGLDARETAELVGIRVSVVRNALAREDKKAGVR